MLIALSVVGGILSMLVLLIADAVQSLEGDDLRMYRDSAYQIAVSMCDLGGRKSGGAVVAGNAC